jgi:CheY-like chemotaxis protein
MGKENLDGYELTEKILSKYSNMPVLIHSNRIGSEVEEKAKSVGAAGFQSKPMSEINFLKFISENRRGEVSSPDCRGELHSPDSRGAETAPLEYANGRMQYAPTNNMALFTIYVIDDEPLARETNSRTIRNALESMKIGGYEIKKFANAEDALEECRGERPFAPTIIFSDINLGKDKIDGWELAKTVGATHRLPAVEGVAQNLNVYLVSSTPRDMIEEQLKEYNINGYIEPPLTEDKIIEIFRKYDLSNRPFDICRGVLHTPAEGGNTPKNDALGRMPSFGGLTQYAPTNNDDHRLLLSHAFHDIKKPFVHFDYLLQSLPRIKDDQTAINTAIKENRNKIEYSSNILRVMSTCLKENLDNLKDKDKLLNELNDIIK